MWKECVRDRMAASGVLLWCEKSVMHRENGFGKMCAFCDYLSSLSSIENCEILMTQWIEVNRLSN